MAYTFTRKYSPNYESYNSPNMIIIHHWGADGQLFNGVVSWLCNPRAQVSAHYVVEAGRVCQLVDLNKRAWHCYGENSHSIGIECRPECTDGDIRTTAELVANIWKELGKKLPLYGHKDFNATACPGRYYSRIKEITSLAEKYYNGTNPKPLKQKLEVDGILGTLSVTALQKFLGTYQDGIISGQNSDLKKYFPSLYAVEYGSEGSACIEALQKYLNKNGAKIDADGYLGPKTIKALQRFLNTQGNNLDVDGYLGPLSAKALQKFLNKNI